MEMRDMTLADVILGVCVRALTCAAGVALPWFPGVPGLLLLLHQQLHQQRRLPQQQLSQPGQPQRLAPARRAHRPATVPYTNHDTAAGHQVTDAAPANRTLQALHYDHLHHRLLSADSSRQERCRQDPNETARWSLHESV